MLRDWLAAVCGIGMIGCVLVGCAPRAGETPTEAEGKQEDAASAQALYAMAKQAMQGGGFKAAAGTFAQVQEKYPYSKWATQAQLMEAYCRYQAHQYEDAIDAFTIFAHLHPYHKDRPYACYMIGLSHYERISIVERDQEDTAAALKAFQALLEEYPNCDYAKDAKFKIDFIRNHLAVREMSVGRFYQRNRSYQAAINRFRTVVTQYQTTEQTPEALLRLAECYAALRLQKELQEVYAVLQSNHPNSEWCRAAQKLLDAKGVSPVEPIIPPVVTPKLQNSSKITAPKSTPSASAQRLRQHSPAANPSSSGSRPRKRFDSRDKTRGAPKG